MIGNIQTRTDTDKSLDGLDEYLVDLSVCVFPVCVLIKERTDYVALAIGRAIDISRRKGGDKSLSTQLNSTQSIIKKLSRHRMESDSKSRERKEQEEGGIKKKKGRAHINQDKE